MASLIASSKHCDAARLRFYQAGKEASSAPTATYSLAGRLYASKSGWILLSVPNSLMRGAFDALREPGIELPPGSEGGLPQAHISVMRPEEIETIPGGLNAITERGKTFHYQLGKLKTVEPSGWGEMARCWLIEVKSPELTQLRRTYGLTSKPNNDRFEFHITVAVRRRGVLAPGETSKAADEHMLRFLRSGTVGDPVLRLLGQR